MIMEIFRFHVNKKFTLTSIARLFSRLESTLWILKTHVTIIWSVLPIAGQATQIHDGDYLMHHDLSDIYLSVDRLSRNPKHIRYAQGMLERQNNHMHEIATGAEFTDF